MKAWADLSLLLTSKSVVFLLGPPRPMENILVIVPDDIDSTLGDALKTSEVCARIGFCAAMRTLGVT